MAQYYGFATVVGHKPTAYRGAEDDGQCFGMPLWSFFRGRGLGFGDYVGIDISSATPFQVVNLAPRQLIRGFQKLILQFENVGFPVRRHTKTE